MSISRRILLHYAGTGCALALLPEARAMATLRRYEVRDTVALPRFARGAVVLADAAVNAFAGDGLYLYPAWGQPRLYEVRAAAQQLEFRNPGTGDLLWTQSAELDSSFAGRVLESAQDQAGEASPPPLRVPRLPGAV